MLKLLLADDSLTTQKVIELTFADEGIEVVIADDGDRAMELFDHHHPDIVLADINIPGLNGYEVCEAIRKRESNGTTPVVLLAGSFEPFDPQEAHRVGANDYLTKPFSSIRRLVATVTALLDSASREDAAVDETIEPDSDAPKAVEAEALSEHGDAPQAGPPPPVEPDMMSVNDIEHLYSQSVVETVEMPHTIAERIAAESSLPEQEASPAAESSAHDDLSYDDELIETTFAVPEGSQSETVEQTGEINDEAETAPEQGQLSSPEIPVPMGELPDLEKSVPQSEIPTVSFDTLDRVPYIPVSWPDAGKSEPLPETQGEGDAETSPAERHQIDQSGDETYFEPALDTSDQAVGQTSEAIAADDDSQVAALVSEGQFQPESFAVPEPPYAEAAEDRPQTSENTESLPGEEQDQPINGDFSQRQPAAASPWESVAAPTPATAFSLDEANLLEIPTDNAGQPSLSETSETALPGLSSEVDRLTPEIVDQIAKVTATQISEELVREIAQRIVPKVIEEVIARKSGEDTDR